MELKKNRLINNINELAKIGLNEDGSNTRFPFTYEDKLAEEFIIKLMEEANLEVEVDYVGNIIGTIKGSDESLDIVITGSHYDTVRNGGKYDGVLGILGAIEAIKELNEEGFKPLRTIKVIAFKDEEGNRFGYGMIGSKSINGLVTNECFNSLDDNKISLKDALLDSGYNIERANECKIDNIYKMIELHIEQGIVLENNHKDIGVVIAIAGLKRFTIEIKGESGHSGATPMNLRKDPVYAMSKWINEITQITSKYEDTVATIGKINVLPGEVNIIGSKVIFSLDIRSKDDSIIDEIIEYMHTYEKDNHIEIKYHLEQNLKATKCDEDTRVMIKDICDELNYSYMDILSGAGHDAMNFNGRTKVAMIFVSSLKGYSHRKEEYTSEKDCIKGMLVLKELLKKSAK